MGFRARLTGAMQFAASPVWLGAVLALMLAGCSLSSAPLKDTPKIVATPQPGQLTVTTQPGAPIGSVVPVYVSVANGSDVPRAIVPSQIFALNDSGARVAPLPPGEAAREAGGASELKGAIAGGAVRGAAEGALGAGLGAIVGSALGGAVGTGAIVGTAVGAGEGMIGGATRGADQANRQANRQLSALALRGGEVRHNFTVSGYVFFPKGSYRNIEFLMVNQETGDTEVVSRPWK
jgi:hypothetical protein